MERSTAEVSEHISGVIGIARSRTRPLHGRPRGRGNFWNLQWEIVAAQYYSWLRRSLDEPGDPGRVLAQDGHWCVPPEERPDGWERLGVKE